MPFVVRNKDTGLYTKVGRYGKSWVPDINDATVYKSRSAVLNSRGTHVKNPKKHEAHLKAQELREKFTKEYGPIQGVMQISKETGEEKVLRGGWPNSAKEQYHKVTSRSYREPFGHMKLPDNLEIIPVGIVPS